MLGEKTNSTDVLMSSLPPLYLKFLTFCILFVQKRKKKSETRTKIGIIKHHLSFVKTQGLQRAFSCVLFLLSDIILGEIEQKPSIKAIHIYIHIYIKARFKSTLICQLLELNAPTCYSHQTSLLKSSENVDNQSYYIVRCSLTAH